MLDTAGLALELGRLRSAADRVERLGDGVLATAGDDADRELLGLFLAGAATPNGGSETGVA